MLHSISRFFYFQGQKISTVYKSGVERTKSGLFIVESYSNIIIIKIVR